MGDRNVPNNPLQNLTNAGMPSQLLQPLNQPPNSIASPNLPSSTSPLNFNLPSTYSFPNANPPFTLPSTNTLPTSDNSQNNSSNANAPSSDVQNRHLFS